MTAIKWDQGTAYDFFTSFKVLCLASEFGLRPSWAAGVRQRIPSPRREFLERFFSFAPVPVVWLSGLPAPKDASVVLQSLSAMPPAERLPSLVYNAEIPPEARLVLSEVAERGSWTNREQEFLGANILPQGRKLAPVVLNNLLELWSTSEESGKRLLEALEEYQRAYFAEEEMRIKPALQRSMDEAQELASRMSTAALVEELSHGVHLELASEPDELVLIPCYWITPLVWIDRAAPGKVAMLFGARPASESIVHGSCAPDGLVNALKSLADPTRLLILRYLSEKPMPPGELARRLHLRPPTVIHHLRGLRLAGLIYVSVGDSNERCYKARLETLDRLTNLLKEFLNP